MAYLKTTLEIITLLTYPKATVPLNAITAVLSSPQWGQPCTPAWLVPYFNSTCILNAEKEFFCNTKWLQCQDVCPSAIAYPFLDPSLPLWGALLITTILLWQLSRRRVQWHRRAMEELNMKGLKNSSCLFVPKPQISSLQPHWEGHFMKAISWSKMGGGAGSPGWPRLVPPC